MTLAVGALVAPARAQDVLSANSRFVARSRAGGEVEVVDVSNEPASRAPVLWTCRAPDLGSGVEWRISDDGLTLVAIAPGGISVVRSGKILASLDAEDLALAPGPASVRLRDTRVDLLGSDERVRSIDLATGALAPPREGPVPVVGSLVVDGGVGGIHREIRLFDDGRAEAIPGPSPGRCVFLAADAERLAVARVAGSMPSLADQAPSAGIDLLRYELAWGSVRVRRVDPSLEPALRRLVDALEELAREPAGPPVWTIDEARSFVDVRTSSAGLLSAFGHDHRLMVRRLSGTVRADPEDPASGSVLLDVQAGSLAVVDEESAKDRAAIEQEMNAHVLEVAAHPTIRFTSRRIERKGEKDGAVRLVVRGDLLLHGVERRIVVPGRLEIRPGWLRFRGSIALRQSDYGIEPTSAAGGTVKVGDEVRIGFDLTAVR